MIEHKLLKDEKRLWKTITPQPSEKYVPIGPSISHWSSGDQGQINPSNPTFSLWKRHWTYLVIINGMKYLDGEDMPLESKG